MRPADWSAAGFASDPLPGDPAALRNGGTEYVSIADSINTTARRLRSLGIDGQQSEAVFALADSAGTVADDIAKAEARYRETGHALIDYAAALDAAQSESLDALHTAQNAREAADEAAHAQHRYLSLSYGEADPSTALRYTMLSQDAGADAAMAQSRVADARARIHEAQTARDRAAEAARDRIENTTAHDGLKDSWWDNWGKDALSVVTDVAGWVASVAGVLALVVSWIPVVGQVLAAALLLVAGIAAVVNAIGNVVLASTGERGWTEAIISIAGAALSVIGLGAAARVVGSAASAARINALARIQSGWAGEALTVRQALRIRPSAMREAEQLWRAPVAGPSNGDDAFRLWGGGSGSGGGSWSGADPTRLAYPRESLGLPDVNTMENLSIGTITDASQVQHVRHALPLDGMPGGGPEWVFRGGDPLDPAIGRVVDSTIPFSVP
ncbi:hypothetical protein [Microbacterium ulmi]|uniref:Uncharacterized protein n=1 Tax=Microbacterium ulmi TaxID=179095 RepID=A0A7Y2M1H2_9MICO|nr:hypothetical protein [Microbacterium ulmi]NII68824.1 hypothetical protein [Microbacterium ulmi]NNH04745.1 hypothetical protein [Microbacterium ulmi]